MRAQSNYHIVEGGGKPHFCLAITLSLIIGLVFFFSTLPVLAQDAELSPSKTEIIQNNESGTVSIVIDGKTVGFFTKDGFHVLGDIVYGGTITDTGADFIRKKIQDEQTDGGADEE